MAEMNDRLIAKIMVGGVVLIVLIIGGLFLSRSFNKQKTALVINTIPSGGSIEFEGRFYEAPATIEDVKEGSYTISISKEGYLKREGQVNPLSNKENKFTFRLYTQDTAPGSLLADLLQSAKQPDPLKELISKLPYKSDHFIVKYEVVAGEHRIVVTLLAILNRAEQMESYKKQLSQYKKEALLWLQQQNIDTEELDISWEPASAANL